MEGYKLYEWLSVRYPLVNQELKSDQIYPFDNVYIPLNRIIQTCVSSNLDDSFFLNEQNFWILLLQYVERLVVATRPQKMLYFALDGVNPNDLMYPHNKIQRFHASSTKKPHEATKRICQKKRISVLRRGSVVSPNIVSNTTRDNTEVDEGLRNKLFDTSWLRPGTPFMHTVAQNMCYFIQMKLHWDPCWGRLRVVFSGSDVPGDSTHKIGDYIRRCKAQPDYDPTTRHCFYGEHDNLIMQSLALQESSVVLLCDELPESLKGAMSREASQRRVFGENASYWLFHLGLLREYIVLDVSTARNSENLPDLPVSISDTDDVVSHHTLENRTEETLEVSCSVTKTKSSVSYPHEMSQFPTSFDAFDVENVIADILFCLIVSGYYIVPAPEGCPDLETLFTLYRQYLLTFIFNGNKTADLGWLIDRDNGTINWKNVHAFVRLWLPAEHCDTQTQKSNTTTTARRRSCAEGDNVFSSETRFRRTFSSGHLGLVTTKTVDDALSQGLVLLQHSANSASLDNRVKVSLDSPKAGKSFAYFHQCETQSIVGPTLVQEISAQKFLQGLQWTMSYFYQGVPDWDWQYSPLDAFFLSVPFLNTFLRSYPWTVQSKSNVETITSSLQFRCVKDICYPPDKSDGTSRDRSASLKKKAANIRKASLRRPHSPPVQTIASTSCSVKTKKREETSGSPFHFVAHGLENPRYVPSPLPELLKSIEKCRVQQTEYHHPDFPDGDYVRIRRSNVRSEGGQASQLPSLHNMLISRTSFGGINDISTSKSSQQPALLCMSLKPQLARTAAVVENADVQGVASVLYDYLRTLFTGDTVLYNYPTGGVGKLIGLWTPSLHLRSTSPTQVIQRRLTRIGGDFTDKKEKEKSQSPSFLYRAYGILDPEKYTVTLDAELTRLKRQGVEYDNCSTPSISPSAIRLALLKALGIQNENRQSERKIDSVLFHEILVEVLPVSEVIVTTSGTHYKFEAHPVYRLLPFVLPGPKKQLKNRSILESLYVGSSVICLNEYNPLFGCTGIINHVGESLATTESTLYVRQQMYDERWTTQNDVFVIATRSLKEASWGSLEEVAFQLDISPSTLALLTRSVWVKQEDEETKKDFDIGMNLVVVSGSRLFCVPALTTFVPDYESRSPLAFQFKLLFSQFAVEFVRSYIVTWPSVIAALSRVKNPKSFILEPGRASEESVPKLWLKAASLFPNAPPSRKIPELVTWIKRQPFASLDMAGPSTHALSLRGVKEVERCLDVLASEKSETFPIRVTGLQEVFPIEVTGSLPGTILAASAEQFVETQQFSSLGSLMIGQRVVYVKWNGIIPFGSFGCVIATTLESKTSEQWAEILTDEPHVGCTDLNGRCSPMRGIQVPASYLLCLCPKVCPWGLSIPTVDEYQWYVQASVQRLERGDPCNALHTAMRSSKSLVHPPKALRPQILTSYSSQTQETIVLEERSSEQVLDNLFKLASKTKSKQRPVLPTAPVVFEHDANALSKSLSMVPQQPELVNSVKTAQVIEKTSCEEITSPVIKHTSKTVSRDTLIPNVASPKEANNVLETLDRLLRLKSSLHYTSTHEDDTPAVSTQSAVGDAQKSHVLSVDAIINAAASSTKNLNASNSAECVSTTSVELFCAAAQPAEAKLLTAPRRTSADFFFSADTCLRSKQAPQAYLQKHCPQMGIVTSTQMGDPVYTNIGAASRQQVTEALLQAIPVLRTQHSLSKTGSTSDVSAVRISAHRELLDLIRHGNRSCTGAPGRSDCHSTMGQPSHGPLQPSSSSSQHTAFRQAPTSYPFPSFARPSYPMSCSELKPVEFTKSTKDLTFAAPQSPTPTRTSSARPSEALPKRNDNFDPFHLFTNTGHYQSYRQHQSEGRGEPVPPEVIPKFSATRSRH